jgi:hypothetical protein
MAITTIDGLLAGFTTGRQKTPISKSAILNMTVGGSGSYWRAAGNPQQPQIPNATETYNNMSLGGINFANPPAGQSTYIARLMLASTTTGTVEIHDRLAAAPQVAATNTTVVQPVNLDLATLGDNIAQRKGRADYSSVQWWLETYGGGGTSGTFLTVTYTNHLGQTGLTLSMSLPANWRIGALLPIIQNNPTGDFIRAIESVKLSGSMNVNSTFGVLATVQRTEISTPVTNVGTLLDWSQLGMPLVYDSSCLMFIGNASGTTLGALSGAITLVQG